MMHRAHIKKIALYGLTLLLVFVFSPMANSQDSVLKLENPITVNYLKKNLSKQSPRLVLNKKTEQNLRKKLKTDPVVQNVYKGIKLNAEAVFDKTLVNLDIPMEERSQNNQLDISRDLLHRISIDDVVVCAE